MAQTRIHYEKINGFREIISNYKGYDYGSCALYHL